MRVHTGPLALARVFAFRSAKRPPCERCMICCAVFDALAVLVERRTREGAGAARGSGCWSPKGVSWGDNAKQGLERPERL